MTRLVERETCYPKECSFPKEHEIAFWDTSPARKSSGCGRKIVSDIALGLYRECGGVVQPGNKTKPIAGAFPIQSIELSR